MLHFSDSKSQDNKVLSFSSCLSPGIERTVGEIGNRTGIISVEGVRWVLAGVVEFHGLFVYERWTGGCRKLLLLLC